MDREIRQRLQWVQLYEQTQHAGLVCRRCGISRPTLRKWWRRYQADGVDGLQSQSRRPHTSPRRKVWQQETDWILELRQRQLGARRIQSELGRLHQCRLALATMNVRRGLYQYTAIDDCTRWLVVGLFPRRTAVNILEFLEQVWEEMPFPVQRIQTDRGTEFMAAAVQHRLFEYGIKYRPIRPRSPHLNGKVERVQKTLLTEFSAIVDLQAPDLADELACWQMYDNWQRPHGGVHGKAPIDRWLELTKVTPYTDEVLAQFDARKEDRRMIANDPYHRSTVKRCP